MATTSSFKQQCPSCEAMVPIRDHGLIGKKIDCPKCKYRFVVEEPEAPQDAEEEVQVAKGGKSAAVIGKRPLNGKAKAGLKRRPDEEDDDEAPAPQKKKEGGSTTLILGVGLAFVAVLLLAVGGYFLLGGSSDDNKSSTTSR